MNFCIQGDHFFLYTLYLPIKYVTIFIRIRRVRCKGLKLRYFCYFLKIMKFDDSKMGFFRKFMLFTLGFKGVNSMVHALP